jgi:hypothetical protein
MGVYLIFNFLTIYRRVGTEGEHQKTPYSTKDEVITEFKKIFKSKTDNEWNNLTNFKKVDKKYNLLKVNEYNKDNIVSEILKNEFKSKKNKNEGDIGNNEEFKKSEIDKNIFDSLYIIFDNTLFQNTIESIEVDFDNVSDEILTDGINLLEELLNKIKEFHTINDQAIKLEKYDSKKYY